jgi:hypothetical protein
MRWGGSERFLCMSSRRQRGEERSTNSRPALPEHALGHRRSALYHGGTMTLVRIADLLASSLVDPGAHLDPDRVRRYAELLDELPPVVAFRTEQGLLLADGYHRVAAAQARGLASIEAEIRHGTAHDALRYAVTIGAQQRGLSQQEVMRRLRQRSGGRWGQG